MAFSVGQKALVPRHFAEAFNTSRVVTIVEIDYYDGIYPYRVEFSDGIEHWVKRDELSPIKGKCAKVV